MTDQRKIIHIDMDAFYASVEQLDHPELAGRPVIVGGRPDSRGVVAACSYEARTFGVRSAMPCAHAYRRCPGAIFIRPRMARYQQMSRRIMEILGRFSDLIEPLSLDEAYLDVTGSTLARGSATRLAHLICKTIHEETGLTASAGVSCNKFVAKIASDLNKPNGVSVIEPERIEEFLGTLPIGRFHGIGAVTEKRMARLDIRTGADLRRCTRNELRDHFGKNGDFFYDIVRGLDPRPVRASRPRKSVGCERTLNRDSVDRAQLDEIIAGLAERVSATLQGRELRGRTITLKVRYGDFTTITRSISLPEATDSEEELRAVMPVLCARTEVGRRPVRLLGLAVSNLAARAGSGPRQARLPFPPALGCGRNAERLQG